MFKLQLNVWLHHGAVLILWIMSSTNSKQLQSLIAVDCLDGAGQM